MKSERERGRKRERERERRGEETKKLINLNLGLHFDVCCLQFLQLLPQCHKAVLLLMNVLFKQLQGHLRKKECAYLI